MSLSLSSPPAPPPPHRSTFWRTLRFRLAVWNAVIVILTAGVILVGLRQGVKWTLLREFDQVLLEDIVEIQLAVRDAVPNGVDGLSPLTENLSRKALGHQQHSWFVELYDTSRTVLWRSDGTPESVQRTAHHRKTPATVDGFRIIDRTLSSRTQGASDPIGIASVRVGASLDLMQEDMQRLDGLVLIAGGVLLLIAPLLGYWLAQRAAQAVGKIIETAARLNPSHLQDRLPIQGTGDELDQLSATINHLLDRIATYLQQRREYLTNIAHELRTPLAAVRSSVEVALAGERSLQEYQELLEDVIEQGESLESLVNQILLLSESESHHMTEMMEPVSLREVLDTAVDMFQGVAEVRGITLETTHVDEAVVQGNRLHLRQLLNNLIDNAVKYTQAGGRIDVQLRVDLPSRTVHLIVRDTGIGISEDDRQRIFDRFFRVDRSRLRDPSVRGTGLGLSICKAIVTAHNGSITCDSQLGKGTTFTVQLPLESQPGRPT